MRCCASYGVQFEVCLFIWYFLQGVVVEDAINRLDRQQVSSENFLLHPGGVNAFGNGALLSGSYLGPHPGPRGSSAIRPSVDEQSFPFDRALSLPQRQKYRYQGKVYA
jgi:hypothetical protein